MKGINLISGSNKSKVRALHEVLARAYAKGDLPTKFFSVTDRDSEREINTNNGVTEFSWNVYHIENYLLETTFVAETANAFKLDGGMSLDEVDEKLSAAARLVVPSILVHEMTEYVNKTVVSSINLGFNPATLTISSELRSAIVRSADRINSAVVDKLSEANLIQKETELRARIEASFADGTWKNTLPGREILKQFVSIAGIPTNYEAFRNQIVSRMASKGYQPPGMLAIVQKIRDN